MLMCMIRYSGWILGGWRGAQVETQLLEEVAEKFFRLKGESSPTI